MLKETAEEYSKYLKIDLEKKLIPIHQSVDEMLTRLEEFETILLIVQQERCNAVGLTGSLSQALDNFGELKELCNRIDALEKFIEHVKTNIDTIERRIDATEEHFGLTDNTSKIKNLLIPLFKKSSLPKEPTVNSEMEIFSTENYFYKETADNENKNDQ